MRVNQFMNSPVLEFWVTFNRVCHLYYQECCVYELLKLIKKSWKSVSRGEKLPTLCSKLCVYMYISVVLHHHLDPIHNVFTLYGAHMTTSMLLTSLYLCTCAHIIMQSIWGGPTYLYNRSWSQVCNHRISLSLSLSLCPMQFTYRVRITLICTQEWLQK